MEIKIQWSELSENQLFDIFKYLKDQASIKIANQVVEDIIKRVEVLNNFPKIGQIEELLVNRKKDYRYLVAGNYKIIYCFESEILITISAVFDCRQNPIKLKKL